MSTPAYLKISPVLLPVLVYSVGGADHCSGSPFLSQARIKRRQAEIGISDRIAAHVHKNPRPIHKLSHRRYQKGLQVSWNQHAHLAWACGCRVRLVQTGINGKRSSCVVVVVVSLRRAAAKREDACVSGKVRLNCRTYNLIIKRDYFQSSGCEKEINVSHLESHN